MRTIRIMELPARNSIHSTPLIPMSARWAMCLPSARRALGERPPSGGCSSSTQQTPCSIIARQALVGISGVAKQKLNHPRILLLNELLTFSAMNWRYYKVSSGQIGDRSCMTTRPLDTEWPTSIFLLRLKVFTTEATSPVEFLTNWIFLLSLHIK